PLTPPPAAACRRPHRSAFRRSAVVTALLVTIVGAPLVVNAVADDGSAVPTGTTVSPAETADEPVFTPRVGSVEESAPQPDTTAVAETVAEPGAATLSEPGVVTLSEWKAVAVAEPDLDVQALLTETYTWGEDSLRVAALQQVLNVEVDGRYGVVTRRSHLDVLEADALSTDGVPDEAPLGPSAEEWAALRDCESGGDYAIASSSGRYRGAYQFVQSTWDSVADRNDPTLVGIDPAAATPADQDAMALALYIEAGSGPWPVCGRHLS
ncbi:MAG: transglycosylase family protein, partial [Ilumatobacter sp.]